MYSEPSYSKLAREVDAAIVLGYLGECVEARTPLSLERCGSSDHVLNFEEFQKVHNSPFRSLPHHIHHQLFNSPLADTFSIMAAVQRTKQLTGVVVSAGKMMKTVKVQVPKQKWNRRIQKVCSLSFTTTVLEPINRSFLFL